MSILIREIEEEMNWISQYGADPTGGMTRLLYSDSWLEVQNALMKRFEDSGMEARFDKVGNLFGRIVGTESPNEVIATGSHIDTVTNGGKLDGQLGIFGGYLAIKYLVEKYGMPKKSLEVISMAEEEGSRFPTVFWGSKNLLGLANIDEVKDIKDINGVSFVDEMHRCGFDFNIEAKSEMEDVKTFVELHIEQGNTLEMENKSVGIINAIAGQRRYDIKLKGEANHAGTTLMKYRKDVVKVFSKIVTQSIDKAEKIGDPLVLTFGKIVVKPNAVNVVPGDALFTMDCRHIDAKVLNDFTKEIEEDMKRIASDAGVEIEIDCWMNGVPVPMNEEVIDIIESVCKDNKLNYRIMHSGAGHDSQIIAPRIPTGMIFVPSIKGISHNPAEKTELEDLKQGIEALALTLYKLAY